MKTFNIDEYIASLPDDITILDVSGEHVTYLPDLTRFKNLQVIRCSHNYLTTLPALPETLVKLVCFNNRFTSLPTLPKNIKYLLL